ncbi:hypothetical protein [Streptomyces albidoflavus]|uniref:hypothetical protein n=1 Tax=Streptomyces albidoflavus TaxID=1886 RepID=UPI0033ACBC9A
MTTTWFRTYYEDEDRWLYFETDEEGWAARHIEIGGEDARPRTAACLKEVLHLRDHADPAAMVRYERRYGVLADAPLDGWQDQPGRPRSRRRSSHGCGPRRDGYWADRADPCPLPPHRHAVAAGLSAWDQAAEGPYRPGTLAR